MMIISLTKDKQAYEITMDDQAGDVMVIAEVDFIGKLRKFHARVQPAARMENLLHCAIGQNTDSEKG